MSGNYPIALSHFMAFAEVMREPALCQHFLETVLDIKIRKMVFIEKEADMSDSLIFRGVRLDIYVEDDENSVYNVEMQNSVESMKRVRYYQSNIDRQTLKSGVPYSRLKASYIIMVCNYDPTHRPKDANRPGVREIPGLGYPMYRRESVLACPVGTVSYDDGSHAIFLNSKYDAEYREEMPEVCEFLDLLNQKEDISPEDLAYPLGKMAAKGMTRFRENEKQMEAVMTFEQYVKEQEWKAREKALEEGEKKGLMEGEAKGRKEGMIEGLKEGEARAKNQFIQKLMKVQNLTREEAEKILL